MTNQTLGEYFQDAIFEPAGLNRTFYDPSMGQGRQAYDQLVWNGGYTAPILVSADTQRSGPASRRQTRCRRVPGVHAAARPPTRAGADNSSVALGVPGPAQAAPGWYNGFPNWDLGAGELGRAATGAATHGTAGRVADSCS